MLKNQTFTDLDILQSTLVKSIINHRIHSDDWHYFIRFIFTSTSFTNLLSCATFDQSARSDSSLKSFNHSFIEFSIDCSTLLWIPLNDHCRWRWCGWWYRRGIYLAVLLTFTLTCLQSCKFVVYFLDSQLSTSWWLLSICHSTTNRKGLLLLWFFLNYPSINQDQQCDFGEVHCISGSVMRGRLAALSTDDRWPTTKLADNHRLINPNTIKPTNYWLIGSLMHQKSSNSSITSSSTSSHDSCSAADHHNSTWVICGFVVVIIVMLLVVVKHRKNQINTFKQHVSFIHSFIDSPVGCFGLVWFNNNIDNIH